MQHIGTETTLDAMLDARRDRRTVLGAGAAVDGRVAPRTSARLFPDFEKVERQYYKDTGIFPIQHVVAIRKDVYKANPWVGKSLYTAFNKLSRDKAYEIYRHQAENMHRMFMVSWITQHFLEMQALLGEDWFPMGSSETTGRSIRSCAIITSRGCPKGVSSRRNCFCRKRSTTEIGRGKTRYGC